MKVTYLVDRFYTRVNGLINKLKSYGENIEEIRIVEIFCRSLPQIIESLVITLEENKDVSQFTLDELQSSPIMNIELVDQIHDWKVHLQHNHT